MLYSKYAKLAICIVFLCVRQTDLFTVCEIKLYVTGKSTDFFSDFICNFFFRWIFFGSFSWTFLFRSFYEIKVRINESNQHPFGRACVNRRSTGTPYLLLLLSVENVSLCEFPIGYRTELSWDHWFWWNKVC